MKPVPSVAAVSLGLLAALLAAPLGAAAQVPTQDSVTGTVLTGIDQFVTQFTFDAHSGPSGENAAGLVTLRLLAVPVDIPGSVTCLSVSGNRASMVFRLPPEQELHAGGVISVEDNGAGQDRLDWNFVETLPSACPVPVAVNQPVNSGNLTITDAQPFPTAEDQCKDGGWRSFPRFKNQGQCIRFVRHQARQACRNERAAIGRAAFRAKYGNGEQRRHAMRRCTRQRLG
jgi:hypothetical protein